MASIYTHKDSNIRKTWLLVAGFFVFIMGLGWFFSYYYNSPGILIIAVVFSVGMNLVSYYSSDKIVLAMYHAKEVDRKVAPEVYNLLENLCITAGLKTPRLYVINSPQPNAFATGRNEDHAIIAVSTGLLEKLEKPELEGVLAHELAHIGNKDMLLSTVIVILVGFISIFADIFLRSLWFGGGKSRRESGGNVMLIVGIVLAILSPIVAVIIRLAISRKREFLADASAVLLTRYPEGLARALEKIASNKHQMPRATHATAHLWISDPYKKEPRKEISWFSKLWMTHPPTEERIKALRGGV
ncbi:MAG: M48 family metallopeptidase [Candidatus Jacksonbacteria bacterium]|nr:M48 family metallopeptidase [Candidatus Jacksonbacteria bacterium]MBT6034482.1 M48 family metallopeptidase [Candidatus Jacksonbacteria bacterium]MBT6301008.1 M48 family metallopeptidase [Candidatus Jacksonbacteria bacterium]MBT6757189.1 M48 family metallopeptidase [Candidatus Jacksonbacteria bacterium]MBT6954836.1 M48 family metallopeptidase [Candidatus Jacksonbacteria bacterium]